MGLKISSQQFRDSILQLNLSTPPDIVIGLTDMVGNAAYNSYKDSIGKDPIINTDRGTVTVKDPGNITDLSVAPRLLNLNKNLQTPNDIIAGINDLTASAALTAQYLSGRGVEAVLNDYSVIDPGTIDDYADVELKKLLDRNIKINSLDPSQSDASVYGDGYNFSSLFSTIGKVTTIHDYNINNITSVSINSNATSETLANLALQQNRYMPSEPNQFESVINRLESFREPYINQNTGMMTRYQPGQYTLSDFFEGSAASSTIRQLGSNAKALLKTDTVLMNIAAMELKFNFENRILNNIVRKTISKTFIDEALTNPLTAIQILKDPANNLFEKNWDITVGSNFLTNGLLKVGSILGLELPVSILHEGPILMPGNYSNETRTEWNDDLLKNTGSGQKFAMLANLSFNKYTPDFSTKRNAGQYIGKGDLNPLSLSNNEQLSNDFDTNLNIDLSSYGQLGSNFAWLSKANNNTSDINDISSYTKYKSLNLFRKGSIMDVTQNLMNVDDGSDVSKSAIDQTKKKLDDGYKILSKGSGVFGITVTPPTAGDEKSRNVYGKIPKRSNRDDMKDAELCRVWTKDRPYSKISDAIRFKELIRKERNSVIDANGNYNIFPTPINVNEGYGREGTGLGDATTEAFGERRARKYMFSLENLAWRNSAQFRELPFCEKGSNGGRIMWFPPYDIKFTDDSTANYTTHTFLGRPEPIYTYNNTERSGSLSFKIVVDHPSILNTLVKYELANMADNDVDEILAAFWSGCIEYDVFELARIWGELSDMDINYFKNVLADLEPLKSNTSNKKVSAKHTSDKKVKTDKKATPVSNTITNQALYFENDVPFPANAWGNYDAISSLFENKIDQKKYFSVKSFDTYFDTYKKLATEGSAPVASLLINNKLDQTKTFSGIALKSVLHQKTATNLLIKDYADNFDYSKSIGSRVSENNTNYFTGDISVGSAIHGFEKQKIAIDNEIKSSKYNGYNLTIDLTAFSSPINPTKYNLELSDRRFQSVAMWIILKVLSNRNPTTLQGVKITADNVNDLLKSDDISFYKNSNELVKIKKKVSGENVTVNNKLKKEFINLPGMKDAVPKFEVDYMSTSYNCYTDPGKKLTLDTDGDLDPADAVVRRFADIVCADLSIVASRGRRVDIKITASKISTNVEDKKVLDGKSVVAQLSDVTKREIVQKLLNKLVNECDYFDYLKDNSPVVYKSLKEKLKYFQPAFHAMTPEGLNARITFLQQCLRPGETITSKSNCQSDAVNTSFGKPPICVLRIGDLYNTKIVINNVNISYDPLVWDLNTEGIGAQPMLADVNMSFKYIGGSGLRKYVEELQNALSFNYYANTDMYDDRTYANTNKTERNLINLEQNFFAGDTLDLAKIVELSSIRPNLAEISEPQTTLIGSIINTLPLYMVPDINTTDDFIGGYVYSSNSIVRDGGKIYMRLETSPDLIDVVSNTNIWKLVTPINYGEKPYIDEYGSNSIPMFKVNYEKVFTKMYESYINSLGDYIGIYQNFMNTNVSPIMLNFLMKQKYGLEPLLGSTLSLDIKGGFTTDTKMSLYEAYGIEAKERNYKEYHQLGNISLSSEDEILKLHLYPQDKFYRMNDGKTLSYPMNKIDPGAFKSIYLKDNINIFDTKDAKKYFDHHVGTLSQKIDHDMVKFLNQNSDVFNRYTILISTVNKEFFRDYLGRQLKEYADEIEQSFDQSDISVKSLYTSITNTVTEIHKLSLVLNGNDGLGDKQYLEVIPNGTSIKDVSLVFKYNPYENYAAVQYNDVEADGLTFSNTNHLYALKDIKLIVTNGLSVNNSIITTKNYNKYLKLGNGGYLFKQISKDNTLFNKMTDDPFPSGTKLPYLSVLETGTPIALNVDYRDSIGLITGNGPMDIYKVNTNMTSTFEKLNYEMLDFSNKTLTIMVNDTISDTSTTFDTYVMSNTSELKNQLKSLLQNNGVQNADQNTKLVNTIVGEKDVYAFNFVTPAVVNQDIANINTKMNFQFKLTRGWINLYNSISTNENIPDTMIDKELKVYYYDELLLLGFYKKLLVYGTDGLIDILSEALNIKSVRVDSSLNQLQQKTFIAATIAERNKLVVDMVNEIKKFIDESTLLLAPINTINTNKIASFSKTIRKTLFNEDISSLFYGEDYALYAKKMLKKVNETDYTLLMRQVEKTDTRTKSLLYKLYNQ